MLLFTGCQEELCEELTENPLRVGFYIEENGENIPVEIDSMSVVGIGKEELLYDDTNVGMLELPLDVSRDSCGFKFYFPQKTDTLKVYYERNLSLVSIECGFVTFFEILDLEMTNNVIKSYSIEEPNITNVNEEHIFLTVYPDFD